MSILSIIVAAALTSPQLRQPARPAANGSVYTSVRPSDCRAPQQTVAAAFKARGLGAQQCPAPAGWSLFVVASDSNSWLELRSDAVQWSSETAIVYDAPIGLFPSAGASRSVEWRRLPNGSLTALIFRVGAQDEADTTRRVSRLFVVRLEPKRVCLLGRVTTNEAARMLADGPQGCATQGEDVKR